jgi:large subunit ribosomal protein L2
MKIKFYKPTSPARRFMSRIDFSDISNTNPEKKLTIGKKNISGRNHTGKVCVRFRGGGHKRRLRIIDFKRKKTNIPAKVSSIEYDPNRSARISLLYYKDGEKKYVITPKYVKVGEMLESGDNVKINPGNCLPINNIPLGSLIHNIEIRPNKGAQLARSAGVSAQLMSKSEKYATVKMPSGEIRKILIKCKATVGEVSNSSHELIHYGKAGRKRWLGFRPHNRGVSMNPVDHPLGGGEGKSSGGRHPVSPWGKPTKGYRTRKNKRTNFMIVKRRTK